ncbi:MAG: MFS transporter [Armatimonadota bacterium]
MDKGLRRRFASYYFLAYLPIGTQTPYLYLFFRREGFTDTQLGTLAAITPIMNIFAPPLWGAVADMLGDRRRTTAALLVTSALIFPGLVYAKTFAATFAVMMAYAAVAAAPMAIADAITLETVERTGADFARLRLWGSLGFAVPLIAYGAILGKGVNSPASSLYPVFIGYAITRLISGGSVAMLPPSHGKRRGLLDLRAVRAFANKRFIALAIPAVIAGGAMSAYYLYFTIYLDQVGIPDNFKGYFWAVAVAAETGMMLVIGRIIGRIGLKWTFVLGLVGICLRLLSFSFTLGPPVIAAVQLLHSLTFAAFMVSTITFVSRVTPPELRASGQTLWVALTNGIGSAAGSKCAGLAAGAFGLMGMFRVFALVAAAMVVLAMVAVREPSEARATIDDGPAT